MKAAALVSVYAAVVLLAVYGLAEREVAAQFRLAVYTLDRGTWEQYGTQLLHERGYWAEAANEAVRNTRPTMETTRALLED